MKARRESPKQYRNGDKTNQHNTEHNTEAKQNQPEQKTDTNQNKTGWMITKTRTWKVMEDVKKGNRR